MVFSTYQSTHIVAESMGSNFAFDLGIFDEAHKTAGREGAKFGFAHKTAGREGAKFGFALNGDNLHIGKRLFLTATPRHYNPNKKDEEGESSLVYSMEDPFLPERNIILNT